MLHSKVMYVILIIALGCVYSMDWHRYINGSTARCLPWQHSLPTTSGVTKTTQLHSTRSQTRLIGYMTKISLCIIKFWLPCQQIHPQCIHSTSFPCGKIKYPVTQWCLSKMVWKIKVSL